MVKKIFVLGDINKKLVLPFLLAISQIIYNINSDYFPEKVKNQTLETYTVCFGKFMIRLIPLIFKVPMKQDKEKRLKRNKCLHYFLLCFFYALNILLIFSSSLIDTGHDAKEENIKNPHASGDFLKQGIEMIFLAIISMYLLKYRYFIHNYIALGAFIIFGLITDLILDVYSKYSESSFGVIILDFIVIITDAASYCYQKYLMEKFYYPYWTVVIVPVVALFIINCGTLTLTLIFGRDSDISLFSDFYVYFDEVEVGIIIGKFFLNTVLNFILYSFAALTLYNFTPDFILISMQLSKFAGVLIGNLSDRYYYIIFVVLQFFCLLIYLEIIELNFCNLNKNTRRNVQIRGEMDYLGQLDDESERSSTIEVSPGYLIDCENDEKKIEMSEKNEDE